MWMEDCFREEMVSNEPYIRLDGSISPNRRIRASLYCRMFDLQCLYIPQLRKVLAGEEFIAISQGTVCWQNFAMATYVYKVDFCQLELWDFSVSLDYKFQSQLQVRALCSIGLFFDNIGLRTLLTQFVSWWWSGYFHILSNMLDELNELFRLDEWVGRTRTNVVFVRQIGLVMIQMLQNNWILGFFKFQTVEHVFSILLSNRIPPPFCSIDFYILSNLNCGQSLVYSCRHHSFFLFIKDIRLYSFLYSKLVTYLNFLFLCFLLFQMSQLSLNMKFAEACSPPKRLKIKIPKIDNSDLIARSSKVLMGRCLNPAIQNVDTFIFRMPQFWDLVGKVKGLNLGNGRFQFEFQEVADMENVLQFGSINFDKWMVTYAPWKPMADVNYPNTIRLWIRITGIPFEYRVEDVYQLVAGAIGSVITIDVLRGKVLIEIPCSKPLIFSSVLEFEEGLETKVMFEYHRLNGFCPLCYRMTHSADGCYKGKKVVTEITSKSMGYAAVGSHTKSFKGALLDGTEGVGGPTRNNGLPGPKKGPKKPRGLLKNSHKRVVSNLEETGLVAEATTSSKKVRRPLFRDADPQNDVVASETLQEKDLSPGITQNDVENPQLVSDGECMADAVDQAPNCEVTTPTKQVVDSDLVEGTFHMEEEAYLDELARQAAVLKANDLSEDEMEKVHIEFARKLEQSNHKCSETLPPGPSKVTSRPNTPLRGVRFKKLMATSVLSPKITPTKAGAKGGQHKAPL